MVHRLQRYWRQSHRTTQGVVAAMLLSCLLLMTTLAACDSSVAGAQNPTPTQTLQVQQCGKVQMTPRGLPMNAATAKQAATCFWQAYQKCQPATLGFTSPSIDTLAVHTFSIRRNGQSCSVTDAMQHTVVPAKLPTPKTYTCTGVAAKADGLHFSGCGAEGDVVVPM
ncbi:hypothetical protein KDW_52960 [Dictyobacter vulcani]|uniref:Lipoprotein n=1 Tax=Dictyobacter vulcani TaxID=2607529 RepID=A0A5J4KP31_9CHLR|nr:hypothetical protein [Dictyobacter vulcani]GER91134.1 hypothetical protein KDW_52960 [Dictyobacter vulcani]